MSVKRCRREVDSEEFAGWMAYAELEPFGPLREDERAGVIAALTANVNRDSKHKPVPFVATDFFPKHPIDAALEAAEAELEAPSEQTLAAKLTAWAAVMADNGRAPAARSELLAKNKKET
jgi:hypothetical protein